MSEFIKDKVVLAYSGGLDTSVILVWLVEKGYEVICFCANVGQGEEDYEAVKAKALNCGATKVYIEDLRKEFVTDYIYPAIKCNAIYESRYLLGTSLARPCIAKAQVKIAQLEGAKYVAHGATGKGNDQVRFELSCQALDANLRTIAPWRDQDFLNRFQGRSDLLAYASAHNIPVDATPKAPYSMDANLFHTSYESGMLEDAMVGPPADMFRMTVDPHDAPNQDTLLRIEFTKGIPTRVVNKFTGEEFTDSLESFVYLNTIAGANGVGRIDMVENRFVGIKSRGVYETPAGTVLRAAHLDLEGLTLDREVGRIRDTLSAEFARLCYNGFWHGPEMELILHSVDFSQRNVTGAVELLLYKGNVTVVGRESPLHSLYNSDLASMEVAGGAGAGLHYDPADAEGFIKINAVRLRASAAVRRKIAEAEN